MAGDHARGASDGQDRAQVLEALRKKLAPTAPRPRAASVRATPIPVGWPDLDYLLGGGLPRSALVEVAGTGGRMSLACAALAGATSAGHLAALADGPDALDPRVVQDAGADLGQVLWRSPSPGCLLTDILLDADAFQLLVLYVI